MTPEQLALEHLVSLIQDGDEFPDAVYRTSKKFSLSEESLKEAYDELPTPLRSMPPSS